MRRAAASEELETVIFAVVGTRPEVIKIAPVLTALGRRGLPTRLVVTGQHDTWHMMGAFLESFQLVVDHQLVLDKRDLLGSLIEILGGLGALFAAHRPSLVLAVGDTTTVLAAALAARKSGVGFGHIEAGLRAFSRELPEEQHRICADANGDLLFAPTRIAVENLARERVNGTVLLTGNPVLDALHLHAPVTPPDSAREGILVTVHRQETVDDPDKLAQVLGALDRLGRAYPVTWPVHPRTVAKAAEAGRTFPSSIRVGDPVGHVEFIAQLARSRLVVTDSGGVQEEAAIIGTPCVTIRNVTERPETIAEGVGLLAGVETGAILTAIDRVLGDWKRFARPVPFLYGDGRAGERIADACSAWLEHREGARCRVKRSPDPMRTKPLVLP
jgi:UDP-N-acetylglucosamine 2-epimerase (non-hydrolysing)